MNNTERTRAAHKALSAYTSVKSPGCAYHLEPFQDQVNDLLADLLHLAAAEKQPLDLERAVRVAAMNYGAEAVDSLPTLHQTANLI